MPTVTAGLRSVSGRALRCGLCAISVLNSGSGAAESVAVRNAVPAPDAVLVSSNGNVTIPGNAQGTSLKAGGRSGPVRFGFGLPGRPPEGRELEPGALPVLQTTWLEEGIRYTQRVLVTSVGTNDLASVEPPVHERLVMVQVSGHNVSSEYTTAHAGFAVRVDGSALPLELRAGLVVATGGGDVTPVALIDIAGEGIASTNGLQLQFRGHMPPGTSGAMTVKIPLGPLDEPSLLRRVQELEFEDEFQRLRRAWRTLAGPVPWAWAPRWAEGAK